MTDASALPPRPNLQQLRNRAKDLCRAQRAGDKDACQRIIAAHPSFQGSSAADVANVDFLLSDAQRVIAREAGFDSWPILKRHVEQLASRRIDLHELITEDDSQALCDAIESDPACVNTPNDEGLPPLYTAALHRNREAIEILMRNGATIDVFVCAFLGLPNEAESLLENRPDLATRALENGRTPLHLAAQCGHLEVAEQLVSCGADVNAVDDDGATPLMEACHTGPWKEMPHQGLIDLLLSQNAKIDLATAAAMGRTDLLRDKLDQDPTLIDQIGGDEETALFHAARNNHFDAVRLLVQRGADLDLSDAVGTAALHRTSQQCRMS